MADTSRPCRTWPEENYIDVAVFGLLDYEHWAGQSDITQKLDFVTSDEKDICTASIIEKYAIGLGDEVGYSRPVSFSYGYYAKRSRHENREHCINAYPQPVPTSLSAMDALSCGNAIRWWHQRFTCTYPHGRPPPSSFTRKPGVDKNRAIAQNSLPSRIDPWSLYDHDSR